MAQKILIVDDKPFMVRLIQFHLEKAGYELIRARNHKEAREAVEKEAPHLVVMDDAKEGDETGLNPMKMNEYGQSIPVIRMTDVPDGMRDASTSPEAAVVMTKPFSPTQLIAEIKRLVSQSKCA